MAQIMPAFDRFKEEAFLIGRMLAGYSELEVGLLYSVDRIRNDFDAALKAMFRTRGESQRISIADALGRNHYHDIGLGTRFEMAIGAIRTCLSIRNQYAHCTWSTYGGHLGFINLENVAQEHKRVTYPFDPKDMRAVDKALLTEQCDYFSYADEMIMWCAHESQVVSGKLQRHTFSWPAQLKPPLMHIGDGA